MYSNQANRNASALKTSVKTEESKFPYIRILEQPQSRGLRFRYPCEKRQPVIEGENSRPTYKTYPTIEIVNNKGPSFVVVSCVSKDYPHRPHPYSINGKGKEFSHGICYMKVPAGENVIVFPGMAIQCVKKADVASVLQERQRMKVNPFMTEYSDDLKSIDMSCVRLCFQVFLEGKQEGTFNVALKPVVSQPIFDKKTSVEFQIKWISHHTASVAGGKVICIISDKMVKDDIQVKFSCEKSGWEAVAEFVPPFIHRQVAVVLKTPAYVDQNVTEPVEIQVMLHRPSDGVTSMPVPFQLLPSESTIRESLRAKRLRLNNPRATRTFVEQHMMMERQQALAQIPNNLAVSKMDVEPQVQDSGNQQNFLNQLNFQERPPAPKTPEEFKQLLNHYFYGGQRPNISS